MDGADIFSTYFKDLSEALHSTSVADITERNWTEVEVISVMTIALQSKQFSFSYLNDCSSIRFLWELEQIFGSRRDSNLEPSILIFFFFFCSNSTFRFLPLCYILLLVCYSKFCSYFLRCWPWIKDDQNWLYQWVLCEFIPVQSPQISHGQKVPRPTNCAAFNIHE